MYIFNGYTEAKTELESYGLTVDDVYLTMLTNLGSSAKRANLYYNGDLIGYIETPTEIQPDEKWVVNIGFDKRAELPLGLVLQIYETENPMLGWTDRQTYFPTDAFSRFRVTNFDNSDFVLMASGPSSTVNLKLVDDNFEFVKTSNNTTTLRLNITNLTQAIRYKLGELSETMAIRKIEPHEIKKMDANEGDIIILGDDDLPKWMSADNSKGVWDVAYIMSTILG